jgi:hypothetical protein
VKEYSKEMTSRTMGLHLGDKQSLYCVVDEEERWWSGGD